MLRSPGSYWLVLSLVAAFALPSGEPAHGDKPAVRWPAGLRPGLTDQEVAKVLGSPNRTSRQVVAHRAVEQWHYSAPLDCTLTFEVFRGQRPRLQSVRFGFARPGAP